MVDLPVACAVVCARCNATQCCVACFFQQSKCGEHYLTDPCLAEEYRTDRVSSYIVFSELESIY